MRQRDYEQHKTFCWLSILEGVDHGMRGPADEEFYLEAQTPVSFCQVFCICTPIGVHLVPLIILLAICPSLRSATSLGGTPETCYNDKIL